MELIACSPYTSSWGGKEKLHLHFFKNRCNAPPVHTFFYNENYTKPTNTPYRKNVCSVKEGGTYSNHWLLELSVLAMKSGYRYPSRRHFARLNACSSTNSDKRQATLGNICLRAKHNIDPITDCVVSLHFHGDTFCFFA
jgi:hypothetical protein